MQDISCSLFVLLVVASISSVICQASNKVDDDLTINYSQKQALDKFKARVLPSLPNDYMKDDVYLINWLRAKNFDVNQAEEFLKENLKWRKANGIDKIHEEDFTDVLAEYPVFVDTYDKQGAPVITAVAGTWNLRQVMLTGQSSRLHRLLYKIMDEAAMKVRQAQAKGKNVTRFHFLLNLEGFNLVTHGCPRCILGILQFIQGYEAYFPGMTDKIVIFNAPPTIQAIRPVVRSALSGRTRGHITLIGTNKPEWQNFLLKFIPASQLTEDFGGTRKRESSQQ